MTQQDALNSLSRAVEECKQAGLHLSVTPMFGESTVKLALFITDDVRYNRGKFYVSDGQIWSRTEERVGV